MKTRRLFLASAILFFAAAAYVLGWSTFFTVSAVQIQGTSATMSSSITIGEKLARVEPRAVAAEFERFSWIKSAQVSRNWISGKVTITLTERVPVAIYNDRAIDAEGMSFPLTTKNIESLPRIQAATIESAVAASAFFVELPQEIAGIVRLIKVRGGQSYVLEIIDGKKSFEVIWGQNEENILKAKVYKALLAQPENSKIRRLDLTAPHAPIVK
jgi:cell division septal protein FtsQ